MGKSGVLEEWGKLSILEELGKKWGKWGILGKTDKLGEFYELRVALH